MESIQLLRKIDFQWKMLIILRVYVQIEWKKISKDSDFTSNNVLSRSKRKGISVKRNRNNPLKHYGMS